MFPVLNNGITRAIVILSGKTPFRRQKLKVDSMFHRYNNINFLIRHISSSSLPFDFWGFTLATNCKMSTSVTGFKNNEFLTFVESVCLHFEK